MMGLCDRLRTNSFAALATDVGSKTTLGDTEMSHPQKLACPQPSFGEMCFLRSTRI